MKPPTLHDTTDEDLVYESELLRVTFPDADIHSEHWP